PGRGYRFVASISKSDIDWPPSPNIAKPADPPRPLASIIGREEIVAVVTEQIKRRRLVTLIGPGGIGKSTVALAAIDQLRTIFLGGIRFVDLTPIPDSSLVAPTLAAAFGLAAISADLFGELLALIRDEHMLLVLDGCEHVVDVVAELAETL